MVGMDCVDLLVVAGGRVVRRRQNHRGHHSSRDGPAKAIIDHGQAGGQTKQKQSNKKNIHRRRRHRHKEGTCPVRKSAQPIPQKDAAAAERGGSRGNLCAGIRRRGPKNQQDQQPRGPGAPAHGDTRRVPGDPDPVAEPQDRSQAPPGKAGRALSRDRLEAAAQATKDAAKEAQVQGQKQGAAGRKAGTKKTGKTETAAAAAARAGRRRGRRRIVSQFVMIPGKHGAVFTKRTHGSGHEK
mmetsp:Transcript_19742/g.55092  ORF Transcript_19742/g.55092 Transcript_19742/m.55092 type:complete len:240 (+) Transcript_19742:1075-1794(+)